MWKEERRIWKGKENFTRGRVGGPYVCQAPASKVRIPLACKCDANKCIEW